MPNPFLLPNYFRDKSKEYIYVFDNIGSIFNEIRSFHVYIFIVQIYNYSMTIKYL